MVAVLGATEAEARSRARDDGPDESRFVGTPEQCVELLKPYRELGARDFLVLARPPLDEQTVTLFAREVAPALRGT